MLQHRGCTSSVQRHSFGVATKGHLFGCSMLRTSKPSHCFAHGSGKTLATASLCHAATKAGGSFATVAWQQLEQAVVLEQVQADAGLDIGGTLIGMHLKAVAVPVRLQTKQIGQAMLIAARTRPKYIGGPRAGYPDIPM